MCRPGSGCQSFYRCVTTNLYQFSCGVGLLFNPTTKTCTSTPFSCPTTGPVVTAATTAATTPAASGNINTNIPCPSALELTQVSTDCAKYYICSATTGTLFIQSCPTGTIFSNAVKNCVPPNLAVCNSATTTAAASCPAGNY